MHVHKNTETFSVDEKISPLYICFCERWHKLRALRVTACAVVMQWWPIKVFDQKTWIVHNGISDECIYISYFFLNMVRLLKNVVPVLLLLIYLFCAWKICMSSLPIFYHIFICLNSPFKNNYSFGILIIWDCNFGDFILQGFQSFSIFTLGIMVSRMVSFGIIPQTPITGIPFIVRSDSHANY